MKKRVAEDILMDTETSIEKDNDHHGFMVLGGETENLMQFASQRGRCNDIDSTNTIKRNLMIIIRNISAIA